MLIRAKDILKSWKESVLSGEQPKRFAVADSSSPLWNIEARPGRVILWGGPPGVGKTALLLQMLFDALRLNDELRILIANVEMDPETLLERVLSRFSGIPLALIQNRLLRPEHTQRIERGFEELANIIERVGFHGPPFTLEAVAKSADEFKPEMICLDYLQRFTLSASSSEDKRGNLDSMMNAIRRFASIGVCVFAVSALARQKDSKGRSSYDAAGLSMAAFRDSSELEFGADDAFILTHGKEHSERVLKHLKSRNGECRDIILEFDGSVQRFEGTIIDDVLNQPESWWPTS